MNLPNYRIEMPFQGYMGVALKHAREAFERGEVPVGAAIADSQGRLVAANGNRIREWNDPTAHAEIIVIREACRQAGNERLPGYRLYVTLEPCPMCAAAISISRISRLYYGLSDPKSGGVGQGARIFEQPACHHCPEIYSGIAENDSRELMRRFFAELRQKQSSALG